MMQTAIITSCTSIWRYCAINLVILGLSMAGLGVFGLAPALAAGYWAVDRPDLPLGPLAKGMVGEWRAEFSRANLLVLPLFMAMAAMFLPQVALVIGLSFRILAVILLLQAVIAILFAISAVRASFRDTIANAVMIAGARPLRLLCASLVLPPMFLLGFWQPLFALYGLFSLHGALVLRLLGSMRDPMRRPLASPAQPLETQP